MAAESRFHIFTLILIGVPKLFIGGEESPLQLSPQPTVNNFALRAHRAVNNFGPGSHGADGGIPNSADDNLVVSTFRHFFAMRLQVLIPAFALKRVDEAP